MSHLETATSWQVVRMEGLMDLMGVTGHFPWPGTVRQMQSRMAHTYTFHVE